MWCLREWYDDMTALQFVFVLEAKTVPKVMQHDFVHFVLEQCGSGL